jgi:primosomal protein N' (replication factor Y) (superfamily II helicase)
MTERVTLFANVILPVPIHQEFTYRVPHEISGLVKSGLRVVVPFGKGKLLTGIITSVHHQVPQEYQAKYIEHLLDENPIINSKQYAFWQWISSYYMSPLGDVMNAALPANFKLASETKIVLHPDFEPNKNQLTDRQDQIIEALEIKETLDLKEISELIGIKTVQPIIKEMIDKRMILSLEELNQRFTPKTKLFFLLTKEMENEETLQDELSRIEQRKGSDKQLTALLTLLKEGNYQNGRIDPVDKKTLIDGDVSVSALQTLEKNGVIRSERFQIDRLATSGEGTSEFKSLSVSQTVALKELHESMDKNTTTLLHGVTGSGKTEIYVQLIQEQLDLGKQILFLLPEIALTTQLIQRLSSYFGDQIGVYHSKFNQNERVEIWNHVLNNDPNRYRIVLGARSSIFLPFQDLGLIIVDEEHESSFKQYDPSPRYNARDASIVLAHLHSAKVILGSATPSMESYFNAKNGKYGLVELNDRFGGMAMPEIFVADVKKEKRQKSMQSHFTSFLLQTMKEALDRKEQIILFQNRRGYTPLWSCEICNWTPKCKNCDVSLTYHKHTNSLKCHYCGHITPPMGTCAACGSNRLKMVGFGTEKVEDELQIMFPDKVIKRLDLDSTRSKNAYEIILNDFGDRKIDILIGTQMVTKGLDFDNVSLVGVLDADHLLNRVDFRAFERSYQLMSQVSGRAGRKHKRGTVIVQTGDPENWVIKRVIDHDYIGFYNSEILERKNFFYPPYFKIIQITLKHKEEHLLDSAAAQFSQSLKEIFKERVLGPDYPVVKRINNLFLKNIIIKIEKEAPDKKVKERLQQLINAFYSVPLHKSIRIVVDVDPA